ncbi:NADH-quinone oxidoreductase subunit 14 [bacterium HR19]|nr:NADH-quinone oxidoreductase subunit 14 [bacterium HR19]
METSFTIRDLIEDWGAFVLSLILGSLGLILGRLLKKNLVSMLFNLFALLILLIFSILYSGDGNEVFGIFEFDRFFFNSCFWLSVFGIITLFVSFQEVSSKGEVFPENFFFVLLSSLGAILMTSSKDFLSLFISKELMSFNIYAMIYFIRDRYGVESAFKYFISSALLSLFYLLGFSFFIISNETIFISNPKTILGILGVYLVLFDLFFKSGSAPFHFWVPDVYQGAPSSTVVFAGSVVKFASFLAIMRIFDFTGQNYQHLLEIIVVLSVIIGSFGGLVQKELKRLLAYSSIAHSGFISLLLFGTGNKDFKEFLLFYLATYGISFAGAFSVISLFKNTLLYLEDIRGFSSSHRFFSLLLSVFLLTFTGLPLLSGFPSKYFAFFTALSSKEFIPVIISAIGSLISLYFYFIPLVRTFMESAENKIYFNINTFIGLILMILAFLSFVFGVYPDLFFIMIQKIPLSS